MVGELLSKYQILEEIGQGGMAVVYRGLDTSLNREVAVKVLHAHLATREESRERFQREAHAVARLRHDNILEIYDYSGKGSERNFIVMEFIHGPTLKDFLDGFTIQVPEIGVMIAAEVCCALAHAHASGIIHRDIKPENIMVRDDGVIKLTDFGIASMVDTQKLTVTGQLLGSPAYMAPEMVTGERLDFRTDVFSVGILLYRLTVGELPFKGKNPHEVLKRIAEVDYIRPTIANPRVGDELSAIITKALHREPDERYESVKALLADLVAHLESLHVGDPRAELERFFQDPADYQRNLELVLIENLLEAGRAELRRGNHARAFSVLNRVLAFDPHNAEVKVHLSRLSQRRSLLAAARIALLVAGIVAAGAGVAWGVQQLRSGQGAGGHAASPPRDAQALVTQHGPEDAALARTPDTDLDGGAWDAADGTAAPAHDAATRRPHGMGPLIDSRRLALAHRRFLLQVTPPTWTLFLDGHRVGTGPGLPTEIAVGPGDHDLEFRDERNLLYPWKHRILADHPGQTLVRRLKWHPARMEVTGTPKDAHWRFLTPAYLARWQEKSLGGPFLIPIRRPGESGVLAKIQVYRDRYKSVVQQVSLRPNELARLTVNLQPLR